jgi:putative endonuclease
MREEKRYNVYIMASRSLTLYTGITGDIFHRALQHKSGEIEGFTKKYHISRLVYYESFKYVNNAIAREKQIKAWTRAKRLALIKTMNPTWQDLAEGWGEAIKLQIPVTVKSAVATQPLIEQYYLTPLSTACPSTPRENCHPERSEGHAVSVGRRKFRGEGRSEG